MLMIRDDVTAVLLENLRALMAARGLNAHTLADAAGMNPTAVYDILSGKARSPKLETVAKLADALGVATTRLIEEPTENELQAELRDMFDRLKAEDQMRMLAIGRALLEAQQRK